MIAYQEALRSGVALCHLVNAIQPKSVPRINKGNMPFPQRENIKAFSDAARRSFYTRLGRAPYEVMDALVLI